MMKYDHLTQLEIAGERRIGILLRVEYLESLK